MCVCVCVCVGGSRTGRSNEDLGQVVVPRRRSSLTSCPPYSRPRTDKRRLLSFMHDREWRGAGDRLVGMSAGELGIETLRARIPAGAAGECSELCVLTVRRPFHPRVAAAARKRPRSFCQRAGGRLHLLNTPAQRSREWAD